MCVTNDQHIIGDIVEKMMALPHSLAQLLT